MSIAADVNLADHGRPSTDDTPVVIQTDGTGSQFGTNFPGVLGAGESHTTSEGVPGRQWTPEAYLWKGGTDDLVVDVQIEGAPGRVSRLAYDAQGPAHSGSVCDHSMGGARIRPGRPSIETGGPVGSGVDLGNYLAVAMAESTYNFPSEDLSQLRMLLGV